MPTAGELTASWKRAVNGPPARTDSSVVALQAAGLYPKSALKGGGIRAVRANPVEEAYFLYGFVGAPTATAAAQAAMLYGAMRPHALPIRTRSGIPTPGHEAEPEVLTELIAEWVAKINARSSVQLDANADCRILPGPDLVTGTALLIDKISRPEGDELYRRLRLSGFRIVVELATGIRPPTATVEYTEANGLKYWDRYTPVKGSDAQHSSAPIPLTYTAEIEIDHLKILADLWRDTRAKPRGTISTAHSELVPTINWPERKNAGASLPGDTPAPLDDHPNNGSRRANDRRTSHIHDLSAVCVREQAVPFGLVATTILNGEKCARHPRRSKRVRAAYTAHSRT